MAPSRIQLAQKNIHKTFIQSILSFSHFLFSGTFLSSGSRFISEICFYPGPQFIQVIDETYSRTNTYACFTKTHFKETFSHPIVTDSSKSRTSKYPSKLFDTLIRHIQTNCENNKKCEKITPFLYHGYKFPNYHYREIFL